MKLLDIKRVIVRVIGPKWLRRNRLFSAFISISLFKSQFFFGFLFSVSFFTHALTAQKDFICGYKPVVDYVNSRISLDQRLMLHYREKLNKGQITDQERVRLTLSLMRYRFLPLTEGQGGCRFYSFLCFTKQSRSLLQIAEEYIQNNPQGPNDCYIRQKGKEQKVKLLNPSCELAIKKQVRSIPFPLGIAQAGVESGWGSSYFAKEGLNFFGVQTTLASAQASIQNKHHCVPARKNNKKCVYKFDSPENSFFIYSQLLNSSVPYFRLWDQRYHSEREGAHPCKTAVKMAHGLKAYAEDPKYISKVKSAIQQVCQTVPNCH